MDAALPAPYDSDGGNAEHVVADQPPYRQTFKDEEHCTMRNVPRPPHGGGDSVGVGGGGGGGGGGGDADKPALSLTTRARIFLAMGLVLEVSASLWAFGQVVSAGALHGDVDCSSTGELAAIYQQTLMRESCTGPIDADMFYNFTETLDETSHFKEYSVCVTLTDQSAALDSFDQFCNCGSDLTGPTDSCVWAALSSPSDDVCDAQGFLFGTNSSSDQYDGILDQFIGYYVIDCWALNPSGIVELTITALVVALSSQLLEAFVGFKYWNHTANRTAALMLAVSSFEALGVVAVSVVLLLLPGFQFVLELVWLAGATVILVVVGALAEITAECSDRAAGRFPYLGAVGGGFIWLGAALLEVVVTSYLLWEGAGIKDANAIAREAAGLFALELLALVAMWVARGLWTRAKLLRSKVKSLEGPLRKSDILSMPSR